MADILIQIAKGAVALLIAVVAIYLAIKLLGKIAKFVIVVVIIALIVWFVLSNPEILGKIKEVFSSIPIFNRGA